MSQRKKGESEGERDVVNMSLASLTRDTEESPAIAVLNSESAQLPLTDLIVQESDGMSAHHLGNPSPSVTLPNSSSSPPPLTSISEHAKSLAATGTMCIVCGDTAPKDTTFRRHYGVVCCEACKCFFRRTVQMSRDYKCRYGSSCSIGRNPVSMKQVCQACRFSQCIKAGMRMESVKRFPRKQAREDRKYQKELRLGREKGGQGQKKTKPVKDSQVRTEVLATTNGSTHDSSANSIKTERGESDVELETDLEHLKFGVASPESFMYAVLDSAAPQLFNYDSLENIHERSGGGAGGSPLRVVGEGSRSDSNSSLSHAGSSVPRLVKTGSSSAINKQAQVDEGAEGGSKLHSKRGASNELQNALHFQEKKLKLESALSAITPRQPIASYSFTSSAPPSRSQSLSQPPSIVNSPESMVGNTSAYNSQENTPYATPIGTPVHSPLPSPSHTYPQHSHHNVPHLIHKFPHSSSSSGATFSSHSISSGNFATPSHPAATVNIPGLNQPSNSILLHGQANTGTIFLNHPSQMPFHVLPVAGVATHPPLLPLVQFAPFSQPRLATDVEITQQGVYPASKKSPFTIIPIPSVNKAQPEEPEALIPLLVHQDASRAGDCEDVGMMSAPPSARASPEPNHRTRSLAAAAMPEAEPEEVLDSLRLRIRSMFKWAKSEVAGFEDLSPLDQKALLRRTVAELVMLGFARGSIAYDDMLLLGRTDKVIRATHPNTGIASVASVTLQKLVVPLKVLNINDRELTLLKEIVLFNPESNGLRNREVVRQYRKRKHIELMEYTEKNSDEPGRFGELLCLLTPLFEASTEVTEQLRLEQFVYEGEARIDALLLMSMINGAEETTESVADT